MVGAGGVGGVRRIGPSGTWAHSGNDPLGEVQEEGGVCRGTRLRRLGLGWGAWGGGGGEGSEWRGWGMGPGQFGGGRKEGEGQGDRGRQEAGPGGQGMDFGLGGCDQPWVVTSKYKSGFTVRQVFVYSLALFFGPKLTANLTVK